jgi:uncharacterized membrane protein HdeD (DUF308 family)
MSQMRVLLRERTGWDVVLGALLAVAGLVMLGNAAFATVVSVLFIGWLLFAAGVLGLAAALFRIGKDGFWSAALGGGLLTVLGVAVLRNTGAAAVTLTLLAGMMFLVSGILRLAAATQEPENRVVLVIAGALSTILGLMVLFNLFTASLVLLGVLLGIQMLVDGLTLMVIGRVHPVAIGHGHGEALAH